MSAIPTRRLIASLAGTGCALLLAAPAIAAPPGQAACPRPGVLSVTGHGESRVAPDLMVISLGVTTQADTAAGAMEENTARQATVLESLSEAGIEASDVQTAGLTLNPMMNFPEDGSAPSIEGYMAQNLLTVRVTAIERAGEVLDSMLAAGANEMQGIRFVRDDSQATEDAALELAVQDATHRAGVMATAAGVELGPILHIGEPKSRDAVPGPMMMQAREAADAKSIPVEGGEVAFTAEVEVSFSLGDGAACATPPAPKDGAPPPPPPAGPPGAADPAPVNGAAGADAAAPQAPAPGEAPPADAPPVDAPPAEAPPADAPPADDAANGDASAAPAN